MISGCFVFSKSDGDTAANTLGSSAMDGQHSVFSDIIERVGVAGRPVEDARTLPPEVYQSEEFFAFEKDRLFYREWLFVGHTGQIPATGDAFPIEIVGEPIVVLRDGGGAVRAYSAVCPHRGFPVVSGPAHEVRSCPKLVCPYHRWAFGLDGRLLGAPYMNRTVDDDILRAETGLKEFKVETVRGFIFICMSDDPPPLRPGISKFEEYAVNFDTENLVPLPSMIQDDLPFNWKIMHENALEPYHTLYVHENFHDPAPARLATFLPFEDEDLQIMHPTGFAEGMTGFSPMGSAFFPIIKTLDEKQRSQMMFGSAPPTLFFAFAPDHVFTFLILPTSASTMTLITTMLVPATTMNMKNFEWALASYKHTGQIIGQQDIDANTTMQLALNSRFIKPGRYCQLETTLAQFNRWLYLRYSA